jgi:predicted amidohydrolase YtcJ
MFRFLFYTSVLLILFNACTSKDTADVIILNADIYTVDAANPYANALAIQNGRIKYIGTTEECLKLKGKETSIFDAGNSFLMPGFIEGHGHFSALGESLQILNFNASRSWDDIIGQVENAAKNARPGDWIIGRGWHQEKWIEQPEEEVFGFPVHHQLSAVSPDNPVLLHHASGHALFANLKAMELAGVQLETPDPKGGIIVRDISGMPTGMFQENAEDIIMYAYQSYLDDLDQDELFNVWKERINLAQEECLKKGITSFQDAGSDYKMIESYKKLAQNSELQLRMWVMLRDNYKKMAPVADKVRTIGFADHYFTCRAIKTALDGALGSYGAWLLKPYNDKPGYSGENTISLETVDSIAGMAFANDMQLCVHAIGDRANREIIDLYELYLQKSDSPSALRWRIEHAQHLNPDDIPRIGELGIIASMQGIHCTSDAPFVVSRLGEERAKYGAYAWRSLLDSNVVIANGTDTPVEDVDPLKSLYASVTRKRADNGLIFYPEQRMTRAEAIYSYTLGNAFAAFEEDLKGSLTAGKLADLVILSNNLSTCSDEEILSTKVLLTMVGGKVRYQDPEF